MEKLADENNPRMEKTGKKQNKKDNFTKNKSN